MVVFDRLGFDLQVLEGDQYCLVVGKRPSKHAAVVDVDVVVVVVVGFAVVKDGLGYLVWVFCMLDLHPYLIELGDLFEQDFC